MCYRPCHIYIKPDFPFRSYDYTVKSNITNFQNHCDTNGLKLRPHIKTHKIPKFAKLQIDAGAVGITCQKISEAEAIISEGKINDILITFNIIGNEKVQRLLNLSDRVKFYVRKFTQLYGYKFDLIVSKYN